MEEAATAGETDHTALTSAKSKRRSKDQQGGSSGSHADGSSSAFTTVAVAGGSGNVRGTRGQQLLSGDSPHDNQDHDHTGLRAAVLAGVPLRQTSPPTSSSPRSAGSNQVASKDLGPIAQVLAEVAALGSRANSETAPPQLPPHLEEMLDFWLRCLRLLERRVSEANTWAKRAHDSLTRALLKNPQNAYVYSNSSYRNRWEEEAMEQLREARASNLQLQKRVVVEEYLEAARAWSRVAADILNNGKGKSSSFSTAIKKGSGDYAKTSAGKSVGKVSFEILKEFLRAGENLPCNRPEIVELKQELKKGKTWLARFNRAGLGGKGDDAASSSSSGGAGGVGLAEIQALVSEAKDICIDVTAELEVAAQATRKYCLCRQPYHGHMVSHFSQLNIPDLTLIKLLKSCVQTMS